MRGPDTCEARGTREPCCGGSLQRVRALTIVAGRRGRAAVHRDGDTPVMSRAGLASAAVHMCRCESGQYGRPWPRDDARRVPRNCTRCFVKARSIAIGGDRRLMAGGWAGRRKFAMNENCSSPSADGLSLHLRRAVSSAKQNKKMAAATPYEPVGPCWIGHIRVQHNAAESDCRACISVTGLLLCHAGDKAERARWRPS
jgi:hypothetical protein